MKQSQRQSEHNQLVDGRGQLSLVEHSLCPLHVADSLQPNLVYRPKYYFTDKHRHKRESSATIHAPLGLSANDEFYLWGLLSLVFEQDEPSFDFRATPHFILRRLGCIDQHTRRGGAAYATFHQAIRRLSHVTYKCDHFYHPIRGEHCRVVFGFFKYVLPLEETSSRAYRFLIDPIFFELCQATGGSMLFDGSVYQGLGQGSRRMFLWLNKIFWRRDDTHWIDMRHLAVDILGYSTTLTMSRMKTKVLQCLRQLTDATIVADKEPLIRKCGKGVYQIKFLKGNHYRRKQTTRQRQATENSPLFEPLVAIGFEESQITGLLKKYSMRILQEWADITLAYKEKFGESGFKKSSQAYFVDNVKNANLGQRTPPDWWYEHRMQEQRRQESQVDDCNEVNAKESQQQSKKAFYEYLQTEAKETFVKLLEEVMIQFVAEGCTAKEASQRALPLVHEHLKRRFLSKRDD